MQTQHIDSINWTRSIGTSTSRRITTTSVRQYLQRKMLQIEMESYELSPEQNADLSRHTVLSS